MAAARSARTAVSGRVLVASSEASASPYEEGPHRKAAALVATSSCDIFDCCYLSSPRLHGGRVGTGRNLLLFDSVNGEVMTICSVPSDYFGSSIARKA